jgi:hypothetical protein
LQRVLGYDGGGGAFSATHAMPTLSFHLFLSSLPDTEDKSSLG